MRASTVINLGVVAALILAALFLAFALCRAGGRVAAAERARGLRVWDFAAEEWVELPAGVEPGPRQMTRSQIEATPDLELSWLAPAYGEAASSRIDEGLDRLFKQVGPPPAARDEQSGEAS